MTSPLPERPNLEQLKRQAKDLLHSARSRPSADLARFRALPAFAQKSDADLASVTLSLHDAQSVVAREHGFVSWNALRERVEEMTLEFDGAVVEFVAAATDGRSDRAERLLARYPRIAAANLQTELMVADVAAVERRCREQPALATEPGGMRRWSPLLYLTHTMLPRSREAEYQARVVAIARRLLELGADANERFPWVHHGVRRPALWAACCVANNPELARLLLSRGANPNDGVTLPLVAARGDIALLEVLGSHGADVNMPWATDGSSSLYAVLSWARRPDGVRWLLDHGANAGAVCPSNGETPLHLAAARWDTRMAEMLLAHGGEIGRPRGDGRTPYAIAALNGNISVAEWLAARGGETELSPVDQFVAACRRGDRATAERMLSDRPALRQEITTEHYRALHQAAERGDLAALEAMLAGGFDPNRPDESIGKTALHSAAHEGQTDAVRLLLRHGASVHVTDREFQGTPLLWAADGARTRPDRDFDSTAQQLIEAGSPFEWKPTGEPSAELVETIEGWRLRFRPNA